MNYNKHQTSGSKLINLRSKDADRSKDTTHLHFHLSDTIIPPVGSLTLISVTNAQIPFVFYTTNSTNNRINLTETVGGNTTSREIALDSGNYHLRSQLETEMLAKLNTGSIVYSMAYNEVKNKFTFSTSTTASSTVFDFSIDNNCRKLFGFTPATFTLSTASPLASNAVCDLTGDVHSLLIKSNLTSTAVLNSSQKAYDLTLAKIPVACNPHSVILYEAPYPFQTPVQTKTFNYLEMQLTDQNSNLIDMQGVHWEMTIQFDFVSRSDKVSQLTDAIKATIPPAAQTQAMSLLEKSNLFYSTYAEKLYEFHHRNMNQETTTTNKNHLT